MATVGLPIRGLSCCLTQERVLVFRSLSDTETLSNCVHPCPCGNYLETQKPCTFASAGVTKYQKRISGPILDRIDVHMEALMVLPAMISLRNIGLFFGIPGD